MIILTFIIVLIDLLSKIVVSKYIELNESIRLIKGFLNLTYVRNTGAAFSIFDDSTFFVLVISALIIVGIILYVYNNRPSKNIEKISYAFILGGAIGNFLDRVINGYVIDFIDIKIFSYNYPIFNLADSFIVIGVIILMIYTWRNGKNGDNSIRK